MPSHFKSSFAIFRNIFVFSDVAVAYTKMYERHRVSFSHIKNGEETRNFLFQTLDIAAIKTR